MALTTQRLTIEVELSTSDTSVGSGCGCGDGATIQDDTDVLTIDGAAVTGYVDCLDDNPVTIPLAGLSGGANVASLSTSGGKVKASLSSTDGSGQAVPVDPTLLVRSDSVAITAITVTRVPGSGQTPRVFYRLAKNA